MDLKIRTLTIKLSSDLYDLLTLLCKKREESKSTFIRRTIKEHLAELGLISEEEQRTLGVMNHWFFIVTVFAHSFAEFLSDQRWNGVPSRVSGAFFPARATFSFPIWKYNKNGWINQRKIVKKSVIKEKSVGRLLPESL